MPPSRKTSLSIAVCLVAVLLASFGAVGLQAPVQDGTSAAQPQAAGDLALPERVVLTDAQASGSAVVGLDAGAAVDSSGSQLEGAYEQYLLEERIAAAESDEERRTVLNDSVSDLERRISELRTREDTTRRAYLNGEIDETTYLATLRSVNDRAAELEERAFMISPPPNADEEGLVDVHGASRAESRVGALRGKIIALQGPVRNAVGDRMRNEAPPERFHVTAAPNGTVLSFIEGGTYHREATRPNVLATGTASGLDLTDAHSLTNEELYPQYIEHYSFSGLTEISSNRIYRVLGERQYEHGSIESYIDAVSENVFSESQQMRLSSELPRASPVTNTSDTLSMTVRPTYDTGPASVQVVDDGSAVANATVVVDGESVAETDENGVAWVVLPDDSPTVAVTVDGETARVTVNWLTLYA